MDFYTSCRNSPRGWGNETAYFRGTLPVDNFRTGKNATLNASHSVELTMVARDGRLIR